MPSPYLEYQYQHLNIFPHTIWDSGDKHITQNHFFLWMYLNPYPNHQSTGSPAVVDQTLWLNSPLHRPDSRQIWIKWALSLWLYNWWCRKKESNIAVSFFSASLLHICLLKGLIFPFLTPHIFSIRTWVPNLSYQHRTTGHHRWVSAVWSTGFSTVWA